MLKPLTPPEHAMRTDSPTNVTGAPPKPPVKLSYTHAPPKFDPFAQARLDSSPSLHAESATLDHAHLASDGQVPIEVRSLGGEFVIDGRFELSDSVLDVKEKICSVRQAPCYKQRLLWQEHILDSHCCLRDLNLPVDGAVFQLAVRTAPTEQEQSVISEARQVVAEGCYHIKALEHMDWASHVGSINRAALPVKLVCQATMYLLAGQVKSIDVHRNGSLRNDGWDGIFKMLKDSFFLQHLLDLPSLIEQGRLITKRLHECSSLLHDIDGRTESDKIQSLGGNVFGISLLRYLFAIIEYHGRISLMSKSLGVDGPLRMKELLDWHANSFAAADCAARRAICTSVDHLPPGQECSQDGFVRKVCYLHSEQERMKQ